MFDFLRKRKKNRQIKTLDYLINLESERKQELEKQVKENEQLEARIKPKEGEKIYASRNAVLLTTETDLELRSVKVLDDHKIKWGKKEVTIMPERKAHILTLPLSQLIPTRLGRFFSPRVQRYRVFTCQKEGEITHDPNFDGLRDTDKMKLEAVLRLQGVASKADIARKIMAGLKEALGFWNYFRDVLYCSIIILLIFAFAVLPNLK